MLFALRAAVARGKCSSALSGPQSLSTCLAGYSAFPREVVLTSTQIVQATHL